MTPPRLAVETNAADERVERSSLKFSASPSGACCDVPLSDDDERNTSNKLDELATALSC